MGRVARITRIAGLVGIGRRSTPLGERLHRRALSEGLVRGDLRWRRVLYALWAWRFVRRLVVRHPETVAVERLRPGQSVIVSATTRR